MELPTGISLVRPTNPDMQPAQDSDHSAFLANLHD